MNHFLLKNSLVVLLLALLVTGCVNTPNQVANPSSDATVKYVYIQKNDSSPNASSAVFTIDNVNNLIYNIDSLPYGTKADSLHIGFTFGSSLGFRIDSINESNYSYSAVTSNAYDLTKPVELENLATDGKTSKKYTISLRVHTVETYLHVWEQLNPNVVAVPSENQKALLMKNKFLYYFGYGTSNALYTSTNGINWAMETSLSGLPLDAKFRDMIVFNDYVYLLHNGNEIYKSGDGTIWEKSNLNGDAGYNYTALLFGFKNKLWAVAQHKTDNSVKIAASGDGINWTFSGERTFYDNFPVSGFGATSFKPNIGPAKVLVAGGIGTSGRRLNTLWSAEDIKADTLNWLNLNNTDRNISAASNVAVTDYGSKLLLFSGTSNSLQIDTIQLRNSINEGMNWILPDSVLNAPPENYTYRTGVSIINDAENKTLYVVGGKSATTPLADVWKIKVNFYSFEDYKENPLKY